MSEAPKQGCVTRRALLNPGAMVPGDPGTVSSLIVQARAENIAVIAAVINDLPGTDLHGEPVNGKLVVVLETRDDSQLTERMAQILDLQGVLSVNLVFHHGSDANRA